MIGIRLLIAFVGVAAVAHVGGRLARWLKQPAVIGEIVAGIALGPSLFGRVFPDVFHFVFAPDVVRIFAPIAQLAVATFMFLVGVEFDLKPLRGSIRSTVVMSHTSILIPFALGFALAAFLYGRFAVPGVSFQAFATFLGAAMAVTAFPVLARILESHRWQHTAFGGIALAVASVDDVTAWVLLSLTVALLQSRISMIVGLITLATLYVGMMLWVVRPLLQRLVSRHTPGDAAVYASLGLMLASAQAAEWIGVHAIFGAFVAGLIMPREERFKERLERRIMQATYFALPAYFALTGLRTRIDLLSSATDWGICAAIILVASTGKIGGICLSARWCDVPWSTALPVALLMNTRGLMELVFLNVGLDLGIIVPTLFTMMVVMALVTTAATSPILQMYLDRRERASQAMAPDGAVV